MPGLTKAAKISLIVAVAENDVIGRGGGLCWRLPSDLKHFRKITMGKPIIMGRKTYMSLGAKPLDGRQNVVVTRASKLCYSGAWTVPDIDEALAIGHNLAEEMGTDEMVIIGGEQIYKAALPHVARIYLTRVHCQPEGDAWFPAPDPSQWKTVSLEEMPKAPEDDFDWSFAVLDRIS